MVLSAGTLPARPLEVHMSPVELPDLSEFETEIWASHLGIRTGDALRTPQGFARVTNCYEFTNPADGKRRVAVAVFFVDGYKLNMYFDHGQAVMVVKSACNKLTKAQAHSIRQISEFPELTSYHVGRDYPSYDRTKYSFERFDMDRRRRVRCTDSIDALIDMGLVEIIDPTKSSRVRLTDSGRAWITANPVPAA